MTASTSAAPLAARRAARRRKLVPYLLLFPGIAWLILFYVVPMIQLAQVSLQSGSFADGYIFSWEVGNYRLVFTEFAAQYLRSVGYALAATVVALVIAYPLAYFIAFRGGRFKNLFLVLVITPFLIPFLMRTLAWKIILADDGWLLVLLKTINLLPDDGRLLATGWAVVAGLIYTFLPFMTLPIYVSLEKIDRSLIEAANDLYADSRVAFTRVTLPLSVPGIVAGTLLTLIPAMGDFVNAQLLGTPKQFMLGNVIQSRFLVVLDYPVAAALSFTLLLTILALVIPYIKAAGTEELVA